MAGARNCGVKMKKAGIKVKIAVTDRDSSLHKGFQEGLQCEVEAQRCTTHLSEGQYKKAHKANFSDTMFATVGEKKTTQQKIKERKRILARDIKSRSGLVRKNLIKKNVKATLAPSKIPSHTLSIVLPSATLESIKIARIILMTHVNLAKMKISGHDSLRATI